MESIYRYFNIEAFLMNFLKKDWWSDMGILSDYFIREIIPRTEQAEAPTAFSLGIL